MEAQRLVKGCLDLDSHHADSRSDALDSDGADCLATNAHQWEGIDSFTATDTRMAHQ